MQNAKCKMQNQVRKWVRAFKYREPFQKTKNALSYQDEKTRYHLISRSAEYRQNAHSTSDNGLKRGN